VVAASYTVVTNGRRATPRLCGCADVYRADLLRQYGYRAPPATWEELETIAATIQAGGMRQKPRRLLGLCLARAVSEDLTCAGLELQVRRSGGRIIEADQTISVNILEPSAHGSALPATGVRHHFTTQRGRYDKWDSDKRLEVGERSFPSGLGVRL